MTLLERLDGALNPIVIKELRQAVRGRFIVTVISLSLLAQVIAVAAFMFSDSFDPQRLNMTPVGGETFTVLFFVLFTATVFFIPLYSGIRMAMERSDSNVDLLFVTTIRPRTIVIGKLLTTMALTALLFCASLPFLIFSYVLRGIDMLTIVFVLGIGFLAVCSAAILALFLGSIPASRPFRVLLGVGFFGIMALAYAGIAAILADIIRTSTVTMFTSSDFWVALGATLLAVGGVDAILLVTTATVITPPSANRALPIRLMVSILWVATMFATQQVVAQVHDAIPGVIWAVAMLSLILVVLCSAVGERERWGPRVARAIPANPLKRFVAFFYFSGAAGGILWSLLMTAATIATYWLLVRSTPRNLIGHVVPVPLNIFIEAALCFFAYLLTALLLRRKWLHRVPPRATWAIGLIVFFVVAILPPLVLLIGFGDTVELKAHYGAATILNPFPLLGRSAHALRMPVLLVWFVVVLAANLSWIGEQWTAFRRFDAEADDALALQEESAA